MSQERNDLQHEQQLLQHFREHSQGEPSAALDARILAAARQQAAASAPRPGFAQRIHAWLFGVGSNTRWSLAFAGLATLGVGLSLTLRTQEQVPSAYDLPSPTAAQAPLLREVAPDMLAKEGVESSTGLEQKKAEAAQSDSSFALSASPPVAAMPRQAAPAKPAAEQARARAEKAQGQVAHRAPARGAGTLAEEAVPLEERLREVLRLRSEGQQALAEQLLQHLASEYPQRDVRAELERLMQARN